MRPGGLFDDLPGNLSRDAARDLLSILKDSQRDWGPMVARKTRDRLVRRCKDIADGWSYGHKRPDVPTRYAVLFVAEPPFIIAYAPETRQVLRILHGARDFTKIFPA
ncbi:type II toxin-antitoxin system RelE/ParE family toxin [Aerophototrophica crusticola]|uniref:Type II toxin-antitoxin system RelE/ParE family toxin n=1 Tax=Aerophototrophica crusticola TaxID=1709002 RepID=A0A858R917_9PROT|nr:type II toxin-antitoxin system RelE/ParE family toxin [Rhodospirillaceae bacterium B3]